MFFQATSAGTAQRSVLVHGLAPTAPANGEQMLAQYRPTSIGRPEQPSPPATSPLALPRRAGAQAPPPEQWRQFATQLLMVLREIDASVEWQDRRFTDLEAEVEAEDVPRRRAFALLRTNRRTLRREPSLLHALRRSTSPLILLEGEPGTGKSVALRHLARELLQ